MSVCLGVAGGKGEGRVVVALEGGYLLDGIANAGAAVVSVLLGASAPEVRSGEDRRLDPLLDAYREELRPFWPALAE
jgi:hypothetical protein